jgi:hypothetical protein
MSTTIQTIYEGVSMRTSAFFLTVILLIICSATVQAKVIHVPGDSTTIQGGIDGAVNGDTVLVADGTYTGDGNRDIDFLGKAIVVMSENGPEVTIIDCERLGRGFYFHSEEDPSSVLQGFMITNAFIYGNGGAIWCMYSSPTIDNCIISGNEVTYYEGYEYGGAGIYSGRSSPIISNCIISNNTSMYCGGGLFFELPGGEHAQIINCIIADNTALLGDGGAIFFDQCPTIVKNCTIAGNFAGANGGAFLYLVYAPEIINSIIWDNTAPAINWYWSDSAPISYSNVEGGWSGAGNIDADPRFIKGAYGDYHLQPLSPCIDRGTDQGMPEFDYQGNPRFDHHGMENNPSIFDMGADEFYSADPLVLGIRSYPTIVRVETEAIYSIGLINVGESEVEITEIRALISGPRSTERILLNEPFTLLPGEKEAIEATLWVPASAPLGWYTVNTVCYENGEPMASASIYQQSRRESIQH